MTSLHFASIWLCSAIGSILIILAGIAPILVIPVESGAELQKSGSVKKLNRLLSFSVGSLLGDVFLHLLPETWSSSSSSMLHTGLWTVAGLLFCVLVEKCCAKTAESQHRITAVMNLVANVIDNFTHGLAIGGSFLVNYKFGVITTFAILVHEVPHEISDFAILLRADFNRWTAVKAQLCTSIGSVFGATTALLCSASGGALASPTSSWIIPFTAGGFLNIALVQVLPELLDEPNAKESLKQTLLMVIGAAVMGVLSFWLC